MKTRELQKLTVKELHKMCDSLGFKEYSGLRKSMRSSALPCIQTVANNF